MLLKNLLFIHFCLDVKNVLCILIPFWILKVTMLSVAKLALTLLWAAKKILLSLKMDTGDILDLMKLFTNAKVKVAVNKMKIRMDA